MSVPAQALTTAVADRRCRICGSHKGRDFRTNGFGWFRCANCGTTQKVLTPLQYQDLNPTYDPGEFLDSRDLKEMEVFLDVPGAARVISEVVDDYLGAAKVGVATHSFLDVGCGMGRYLIAARRLGFDVLGFEPSAGHARVATQHFQLPVVADYFSAKAVGGRRFDLIMLSHVIEHIYDPKAFVHALIGVLKPGGALVVITPNNESLLARAAGRAWPMLKPVDHVSMIGAGAYAHFDLDGAAEVHHSSSEYPYEFAASALAAFKAYMVRSRREQSTHQSGDTACGPPPLRSFGIRARLLRYGLSAASLPMYLAAIATGRQACLKTIVIRTA